METKDILNIVFSSLSILFGSGVILTLWDRVNLKKRLNRERQVIKAERILHRFLLPLKFLLDQNRKIHGDLTSMINLEELEYAPDYIQRRIREVFPVENDRRFWFSRLETIIENNRKATDIIQEHSGLLPEGNVRKALNDFVFHAQAFQDIWRKIESNIPPAMGRDPNTDLYSEKYPANLDRELMDEIAKWTGVVNA